VQESFRYVQESFRYVQESFRYVQESFRYVQESFRYVQESFRDVQQAAAVGERSPVAPSLLVHYCALVRAVASSMTCANAARLRYCRARLPWRAETPRSAGVQAQ